MRARTQTRTLILHEVSPHVISVPHCVLSSSSVMTHTGSERHSPLEPMRSKSKALPAPDQEQSWVNYLTSLCLISLALTELQHRCLNYIG